MFDPMTLDQLRTFVAVVEAGSFSAAARKLSRVQSAVSATMANLEEHLGVTLWDRSTKLPKLTDQGRAVLAATERVLLDVDALKRVTSAMKSGLEASVSLCVDALFPLGALVELCAKFAQEFPAVDLRVDTQLMSAVSASVLAGLSTIGVVSEPGLAPGLERRPLATVQMVPVVAPGHPLAAASGREKTIPLIRLAETVQIVLSERSEGGIADKGVLSPRTWRVADLHTKHAMLLAGLGWGNLPQHVAEADLRAGKLVAIRPDAWNAEAFELTLFVIYRSGAAFGPAHRWLAATMETLCAEAEGAKKRRAQKSDPRRRATR